MKHSSHLLQLNPRPHMWFTSYLTAHSLPFSLACSSALRWSTSGLSSWSFFSLYSCCAVLSPQLCPTLCDPMDCSRPGTSVPGDSPGKNAGVDCHTLLQRIFPTQGLNPDLPHCRQILYHLNCQFNLLLLYKYCSKSHCFLLTIRKGKYIFY